MPTPTEQLHRAPRGLIRELELMQAEFEGSGLEVILVPLNPKLRGWNEGGCKRVAANRNCDWYRSLCKRHPSSRTRNKRHHDTRIKRKNVASVLSRLLTVGTRSKYAPELIRLAQQRMKEPK
jgi:hypothetical protein